MSWPYPRVESSENGHYDCMVRALVNRYGSAAVVHAMPYMLDDGQTPRWIVVIDPKLVAGRMRRRRESFREFVAPLNFAAQHRA